MKGKGLSTSPNWYTSHSCDAVDGGLVSFAGKDVVYFLDISEPASAIFIHSIKLEARVTCLSLNPFSKMNHGKEFSDCDISVVAGMENGQFRILKSSEKEEDARNFQYDKGNKITCVSWSAADQNILACSDDNGKIILYVISPQNYFSAQFIRSPIVALKCFPHHKEYLAAGYKGGSILIVDFENGTPKVVYRLRGHNDDVHSIQWCSLTTSFGKCVQLISGSKDRTVRVWNIHSETCEYIFDLPGSTSKKSEESSPRQWTSVHWSKYQPTHIQASTFSGEVLYLDLNDEKNQKTACWKVFKSLMPHTRSIFTMYSTKVSEGKVILITTSLDRQINLWDLHSYKSTSVIPTLGGFVYSLDISPVDNSRLAIGCGDQILRVWNISSPHTYQVSVFWQGLRAKILSLAWHPVKENLIAFGTDQGRVGIYNIFQNKHQISKTYHICSVYNLQWGLEISSQSEKSSDVNFLLYSCGDGIVFQHDPANFQSGAININRLISSNENLFRKRTDIAWKPDWSTLALGNDDGSIEIVHAASGSVFCEILVHHNLIQCIKWHPLYTSVSGNEKSPHHCWLAASSNDKDIHVFDLSYLPFEETEPKEKIVVNSSTIRLKGHSLRVPSVSWSPHSEALLVSTSYDNSVQVWDVTKSEPLANFRGHLGRMFCAVWNPFDPDEVFSGGDDATLQTWKISQQNHKVPPTINKFSGKSKKKKKDKNQGLKPNSDCTIDKLNSSGETIQSKSNFSSDPSMPSVSEYCNRQESAKSPELLEKLESSEESTQHGCEEIKDCNGEQIGSILNNVSVDNSQDCKIEVTTNPREGGGLLNAQTSKSSKRKTKSVLPVSSSFDNRGKVETHEDCLSLLNSIYEYGPSKDIDSALGTYLEQDDVFRMLNNEVGHHEECNIDFKLQLEIWKGNIGGALRYAAQHHKLSDWLVSLAPLGSPMLWHEMCKLYAEQLLNSGDYRKSVTYFLAVHEIFTAINVLKKYASFREAVALAKSRLPANCGFVQQLVEEWAVYAESIGQLETSAKCYLSIKKPQMAIKVLSKRTDGHSNRVCAHIAAACGNEYLVPVYVRKCLKDSLEQNNWDLAFMLCNELAQADEVLVKIHKWVIESLNEIALDTKADNSCFSSLLLSSSSAMSDLQKEHSTVSVLKYQDESIPASNKELSFKIAVNLTLKSLTCIKQAADVLLLNCLKDCCALGEYSTMQKIIYLNASDEVHSLKSRDFTQLSLYQKCLMSFYVMSAVEMATSSEDKLPICELSVIFFDGGFTWRQRFIFELTVIEKLISSKQVVNAKIRQSNGSSGNTFIQNEKEGCSEFTEITFICPDSDNDADFSLEDITKSQYATIETRISNDENNNKDWQLYVLHWHKFRESNLSLSTLKSRQLVLQKQICHHEEKFPEKLPSPNPYACISSLIKQLITWLPCEVNKEPIRTKLKDVLMWYEDFALRREDLEEMDKIKKALASTDEDIVALESQ